MGDRSKWIYCNSAEIKWMEINFNWREFNWSLEKFYWIRENSLEFNVEFSRQNWIEFKGPRINLLYSKGFNRIKKELNAIQFLKKINVNELNSFKNKFKRIIEIIKSLETKNLNNFP